MSEDLNKSQLDMWNAWNASKRPEDLYPLLDSLDPLIKSQMSRYARYSIPRNVLRTQASLLAREAIEKYDPTRGVALGTHVTHGLRPLNRFVQSHANVKYVPERVSGDFGKYEQTSLKLNEKYGRPPTRAEIAKAMGQTEQDIERIELAKSPEAATSYFEEDREDLDGAEAWRRQQGDKMAYLRAELKGVERKAFDLLAGRDGRPPIMNKGEVAKKLGIPVSEVYAMTRRWTRRLS